MTKRIILARLARVEMGNLGEFKPLRDGVKELKINHTGGFRIYFIEVGHEIIFLLAGGGKRTQDKDIDTAIELAKEVKRRSKNENK